MSEELKPCPFCGGAVKMTRHKGSDETGERWDYFAVECRGKDHNVICDSGDTAEEVAAAWNRRAPMTALTTPPAGEEKGERDAHDLKWAIARLYQIEADFTAENTATSRNDSKAIVMVLEEIDRLSSPRVEEERRMREALLISRGFVVAALEAHPDMKGLDVNDHLVVREIDAALSPQGG